MKSLPLLNPLYSSNPPQINRFEISGISIDNLQKIEGTLNGLIFTISLRNANGSLEFSKWSLEPVK